MLRSDRASALLLFPAAFFAMLVLGALAVDITLVEVRARELRAVAASSADDALGGLDVGALRDAGELVLDPGAVERIVRETVAAGPVPEAAVVAVDIRRVESGRLETDVTMQLDVALVLEPELTGRRPVFTVTRSATAVVIEAP